VESSVADVHRYYRRSRGAAANRQEAVMGRNRVSDEELEQWRAEAHQMAVLEAQASEPNSGYAMWERLCSGQSSRARTGSPAPALPVVESVASAALRRGDERRATEPYAAKSGSATSAQNDVVEADWMVLAKKRGIPLNLLGYEPGGDAA